METTYATATSSPTSPLCFYPSGSEETDKRPNAAFSNPSTRSSKKVKVQNKEWTKEQNYTISRLYEINHNLQQEASDFRNRYEALSAENSSPWMEQRMMDQQKQQVLYRESNNINQKPQSQMDHRSTTSDDHTQYKHDHVGVVSPQFWSLGGGGATRIPDLNANVNDTASSLWNRSSRARGVERRKRRGVERRATTTTVFTRRGNFGLF